MGLSTRAGIMAQYCFLRLSWFGDAAQPRWGLRVMDAGRSYGLLNIPWEDMSSRGCPSCWGGGLGLVLKRRE